MCTECERPAVTCGLCRACYDRDRRDRHDTRTAERRAYVIAEVEFMGGWRDSDDLAAALGYATAKSLADTLRTWGRRDLAARVIGMGVVIHNKKETVSTVACG